MSARVPRRSPRPGASLRRAGTACAVVAASLLLGCRSPDLLGRDQGPPVEVDVSFPNAAHHEAGVEIVYRDVPTGPFAVRMSRASPGRYAPHEFGVNVYRVRATDGNGERIELQRPDPHSWRVPAGHAGTVRFRYTVFGEHASGTYAGIDRTHAHLNMPAVFAYAPSLERRPVRVRFRPPDGAEWRAATQLVPADGEMTFTASDLDYFMDSPTELSDFRLRSWEAASGRGDGETETIRLAVHDTAGATAVDSFAAIARRVVREQRAVFGELPSFDYGSYTFIADYLPWVHGDGMEHRNSTILTSTHSLAEGPAGNAGTLAHEFFHAWSVERFRPADIEPFDFAAPRRNMTDLLWFAEGFTSYYDDLTLRRAGVMSTAEFARSMGRTLDAVENGPGRRFRGPADMSRMSPVVDGASHAQRTNLRNSFISYYTYGTALALGLDLTLRARYPSVTLDDVMREVWERHGRTEEPYRQEDLRRILAEVTGDEVFADRFFREYVEGAGLPPFGTLLARAGLRRERARPGSAWLGSARLEADGDAVRVASGTRNGSPLYEAGIDRGDRILTAGGEPVSSPEELRTVVAGTAPGDRVVLGVRGRGGARQDTVRLVEDPTIRIRTMEAAGTAPSDEQRAFRRAWLGSRVGGR